MADNIAYTLQILHASSLEGGTNTFQEAINFTALVDGLEEQILNSITLSTGDNFLPGPVFFAAEDLAMREALISVYQQLTGNELSSLEVGSGRLDATLLNIIGLDASALGNHELSQGTSTFAGLIGADLNGTSIENIQWLGTQFPYLATNLDFSQDNSLSGLTTTEILTSNTFQSTPEQLISEGAKPRLAPATIIEEGGEKIGVLGVSNPLFRDITQAGGIQVLGDETAEAIASVLQPTIDILTDQGINKIILLSDLPSFDLDQELIKQLQGVDVLLSGTTTFLADDTDTLRPDDTVNGTYPLLTTDKDNNPALIVTGGNQYKYLGRLVLDFDAEGKIITENLDPTINGMYATTDEMVQSVWEGQDPLASGSKGALVKELTDSITQLIELKDTRIFGKTDVLLNGERNSLRTEETNFGDMLADANLAAAQKIDPTVAVAIQNAGSIRASLPVGEISQLDVETVLRFNNELLLVTVTASELKTLLENGVSRASAGETSGRFPQVSGLKFSFDTTDAESNTIPVGERIQTLALVDNEGNITDVIVQNGEIVGDADRSIRVVTLKFLADGGDDYDFPSLGENVVNAEITEQQSFKDFLEAYQENAYNVGETLASEDLRIQNLDKRNDNIIPDVNPGDINETPTDLSLDSSRVDENVLSGTVIGNFATTDPDVSNTFVYSLVSGDGSSDNSLFAIRQNQLTINVAPDFETKSSYNIRVRTTDQNGLFLEKPLQISVNDIAENDPITDVPKLTKNGNDVFNIKSKQLQTTLQVTLNGRGSRNVNELGVFTVDDGQGRINGIAPGENGYNQAALTRMQTLFSTITNNPNGFNPEKLSHMFQFDSNENLRFYLVINSTLDAIRAGKTPISDVLFSSPGNQSITPSNDDGFILAWQDGSNNTANFQDLVVKLQASNQKLPLGAGVQNIPQGEMIDLRDVAGQVKADFVVNREAAFNNFVGFYKVANINGGIDTNGDGTADVKPGDSDYIQAAIGSRVAGIELTVNNQGKASFTDKFDGGALYAPFMIVNGRPDIILDSNPNNDPQVYFPFLGANSDRLDHVRMLGNNTFGFEDLAGGGDGDYNDIIVQLNLTQVS
ncbi:5'-nucleotidase C-terminal domain-containing protein [Anabaena sp. UHCC 0187]|uniref:5'-nucleotidase C-terminal domain-containing protein n=1 Tax=Anabaena sp. UHCC 0187 TaxID=2590018 RepID=UPI0015808317|nr:5'-nucleotidase C-terminal domain-containing protein [Anabaena sp. UHCC 0187]